MRSLFIFLRKVGSIVAPLPYISMKIFPRFRKSAKALFKSGSQDQKKCGYQARPKCCHAPNAAKREQSEVKAERAEKELEHDRVR